MKKQNDTKRIERVPGYIVGELSDYFAFEDLGAPAISVEPRGGTASLEPRPPQWPPQANPELMALVYRRLTYAQRWCSKNIFAVLRARYSASLNPRDAVQGDQAKHPRHAAQIDHAEWLYVEARSVYPQRDRRERERERLMAKERRAFGETQVQRVASDD